MKRLEVYKHLLSNVLKNYSGINNGSDEYCDIQDYLDNDNIIQALQGLNTTALKIELRPLLLTILDYINDGSLVLDEIISVTGQLKLFQKHSNKKYSRPLSFFSTYIKAVETCTLYKKATERYSVDELLLLESIFIDSTRQKNMLKELTRREKADTYIIQFDKTALGLNKNEANNLENIYAFAFAASLNAKKKIDIPDELHYSWGGTPILAAFTYNKYIVYQEYYDIYDVFNDWLHATDILTAFLKMYQIAEYMIYRSQMTDIVNRANIKQSFLRETKALSSKYTEGERSMIINTFPRLFNDFHLNNAEVINSWTFVDKYFGKSKNGNHYLDTSKPQTEIDTGVARFIYDTRCSIVHNKESEFHILYNNYDEYKDIVPLMVSINNIMAEKILEILKTVRPAIHYEAQTLELY